MPLKGAGAQTKHTTEASHDIRKMYEPQLSAYKNVWKELPGELVSEAEIFFIMKRLAKLNAEQTLGLGVRLSGRCLTTQPTEHSSGR